MTNKTPEAFKQFTARFPELATAWDMIGEAGKNGPIDEKTARLIKLGIAIGAQKEGPAHASVRKASKLDISLEEMEQVVALAAGTIGMPAAVAAWCWVKETVEP